MAKNQDLRLTPGAGPQYSNQGRAKQSEKIDHQARASADSRRFASGIGFPTGTGDKPTNLLRVGKTLPLSRLDWRSVKSL
jgi:hypothetical protein